MPHSFTSIATFTEAIARILEKYQVDSGDLFEQVGLSREPFRDPDARVKMSDMIRIWEEAERRTKNPCIGFEVGMGLRATNFHAVGYAWLSSATIREALNRMVRYQKLLSTAADMTFEVDEKGGAFVLDGHAMAFHRIRCQWFATNHLALGRWRRFLTARLNMERNAMFCTSQRRVSMNVCLETTRRSCRPVKR
jgi:hypothetical protein